MAGTVWREDIVYHLAPDFPDHEVIHGVGAMVERIKETWMEAFGVGQMRPRQAWWAREPEAVLIELEIHPVGESSGVELDVPFFQLVRLDGLQAVEVWEFTKPDQAFDAARSLV
jgi:hypothetical protein